MRRAGRHMSSALIVLQGRICSGTDICLKTHVGTWLAGTVLTISGICLALCSFNQKVDLAGSQHFLEDRRVHANEPVTLAPVLENLREAGGPSKGL